MDFFYFYFANGSSDPCGLKIGVTDAGAAVPVVVLVDGVVGGGGGGVTTGVVDATT